MVLLPYICCVTSCQKDKRHGDAMQDEYFRAGQIGTATETRGVAAVQLGHQLHYRRNSKPDGIFVQWEWNGAQLVVCNDRYGFYPMFYYCKDREIAVSPSITRLIREQGAPTELDYTALAVFLRLGYFVGEDTPFRYIRALPPGAMLKWDGALKLRSDGYVLGKPCEAVSHDKAVDAYITLFRQAIARRPPAGHLFAVPLSGGRDSRHILFELLRQGFIPKQCVTGSKGLEITDGDVEVASLLVRELGLSHLVLQSGESLYEREWRKNVETSFCADEHTWYMGIADYLSDNYRLTYDGIGGDILSQGPGLRLTRKRLELFESGNAREIASDLLADNSENLLRKLLRPDIYDLCAREAAMQRLESEIKRHFDAPNPVGSFFFWNRTRREIALAPYGLLGSLPIVFAPYLDHDLYDYLITLPARFLLDHPFHTDTISKAYPEYQHIPFESTTSPSPDLRNIRAQFVRSVAKRLLPRLPSRLMRSSFLFPRLLAALANEQIAARGMWRSPLLLYLHQLESLSCQV